MILAGPKMVPSPYVGVSPAFAVWGLPTNFAASPKPGSIHRMPVGIIDYGVPIVDEPMGSDRYMTLPGPRKGLIFDPGETRIFRDPLRGTAERFRDPKVSWRPDTVALKGDKNIAERGDNFIDIDNGYHPPEDVSLVMQFMQFVKSHADDRVEWRSDKDGRLAHVSLAKGRLWIPVRADSIERKFLFRKRDIPALIFAAKMEFGSTEVAGLEIRGLYSQSQSLNMRSPEWLRFKVWVARELSADMPKVEISLRAMLEQEHVIDFLNKTFGRYGIIKSSAPKSRENSNLHEVAGVSGLASLDDID